MIDIDALAQEIRRVDGNHELGAGALAEALAPFITAALAAMPAEREIDEGRFEQWTLADFAGQCRMQARDNLDPEYSQFMAALSARLSALAAENERLREALAAAKSEFDVISCEGVTETKSLHDAFDRMKMFADRGASSARAALEDRT